MSKHLRTEAPSAARLCRAARSPLLLRPISTTESGGEGRERGRREGRKAAGGGRGLSLAPARPAVRGSTRTGRWHAQHAAPPSAPGRGEGSHSEEWAVDGCPPTLCLFVPHQMFLPWILRLFCCLYPQLKMKS